MLPDVGASEQGTRDDLDQRNAEGHVVWGPMRARDALRQLRAERMLDADIAERREATKTERRRAARAEARRIRRRETIAGAVTRKVA